MKWAEGSNRSFLCYITNIKNTEKLSILYYREVLAVNLLCNTIHSIRHRVYNFFPGYMYTYAHVWWNVNCAALLVDELDVSAKSSYVSVDSSKERRMKLKKKIAQPHTDLAVQTHFYPFQARYGISKLHNFRIAMSEPRSSKINSDRAVSLFLWWTHPVCLPSLHHNIFIIQFHYAFFFCPNIVP